MSQQTKQMRKTGAEAAKRLNTLFERWAREATETSYQDEPSWEEVKKALNEGRPADGKPFPEE